MIDDLRTVLRLESKLAWTQAELERRNNQISDLVDENYELKKQVKELEEE